MLGELCWMTCPLTSSVPESAWCAPVMTLMRVDFPAPFSPTSASTSHGSTSTATPLTACPPAHHVLLVRPHFRQPVHPPRHLLLHAVVIPPRSQRQRLHLLQQRQARGKISGRFVSPQKLDRLEQRRQQRFEHRARADDPRRD